LFEIDHLFLAVFVPHGLRWKNESDKPDRGNKRDHPTSVIQVPALVVTKPRLWLDEHRKMARMKSFSDTILGETFRNLRIQLNDAKLLTPHILVPMKECWLFLRSGDMAWISHIQEVGMQKIGAYMGSLVRLSTPVLVTVATSIRQLTKILPTRILKSCVHSDVHSCSVSMCVRADILAAYSAAYPNREKYP
jgi:hypothetical protein